MRNSMMFIGLMVAAAIASPVAMSDENCADIKSLDTRGSEIQIFIENDMLAHSDQYYTNGIKVGIGVPGSTLAEIFCNSLKVALAPFSRGSERLHFGWFVGQNLYTPKVITIATAQPHDRPWAAWSYLGGVAQRVSNHGARLDTVEIDLGMVGPPALGDQIQTAWHRLIGASKPVGWDNQIPSEPAFLVSYVQKRKYGTSNIDVVPHIGITGGNVFTLARAGAIARFGINMSGFGPDSIEPGGAMLQNTRDTADPESRRRFEAYGFFGFDGRLVGRNIFLDGTVFRDSPSVSKRTFVHDFTLGASVRYRAFRISLTRILRSEEFRTVRGGGTQMFDSFNLGIEF
jgi:lipid A 3-O-deacylase